MQIKKLPPHPRLMLTEDRIDKLQQYFKEDEVFQKKVDALRKKCDGLLKTPVCTRRLDGDKRKRMLGTSREVLKLVMYLGTSDKIEPNKVYQERVIAEMLSAADFIDWHDNHFLDTAEMTAALALGYDWYFDVLTDGQKQKISGAIISKGLEKSYDKSKNWWVKGDNNWNQVCHCGMVLGALATYEQNSELAEKVVQRAEENIHTGLESYAPDGIYKEGCGYWVYGTSFTVLMAACLNSAIGDDWNILEYSGFKDSFDFVIHAGILPSKQIFSYADSFGSQPMPLHMWLGEKTSNEAYCQVSDFSNEYLNKYSRMYPISIIYYQPSEGTSIDLPLTWHGKGDVELSIARTSWDTSAIYTGIKAGKIEGINHGHMDVGSFIFEMKGEQWATDLGSEKEIYDSTRGGVWSTNQDSVRWEFFRVNSLSHNTLSIGGELQNVAKNNPIISTTTNVNDMSTTMDMSNAYEGNAEKIIRKIAIIDQEKVVIKDEYKGIVVDKDLIWNMTTEAKIEIDKNKKNAILTIGNKSIYAKILSPDNAFFEIASAKPETAAERQNEGYSRLQAKISTPVKDGTLEIEFSEEK
ncbi:MAG: heparinase II/III family protein [Kiritimatiellae bacterium]|nr:heparinase II/III family protein [Kiritimatiellia bacterium]